MNRPWQTGSAFSEALIELIPEHTKKKTPQFIQKIVDGELTSSDDVHVELREWQKRDSQRAQKLKPVFQAINDYDGIIGILCSADPYPSALIWGGLKAVVECFRRYYQVFEQLEGQLKSLTHHLKLLKQYEELFCESEHMKDLLIASYKGIIRFWVKVEEHCTTPGFVRALKTVTSISVTKINEIITDIGDTGKIIERLVPILQEQRRRTERDETVEERQDTHDKLDELLRRVSTKDQVEQWSRVCEWIMGRDGCKVSERVDRPYEQRVQTRLAGTGDWLLEDAQYNRWLESGSEANILWLRGGAGVGKSTICSQTIDRLEAVRPEATVAFHFFSFDEEQSPRDVYRNVARRLFFSVYSNERDEISEEVLELVRSDPMSMSISALQLMVAALVAEAKGCFILLDGLDEELENSKKERWQNARALLTFFITLASAPDSGLKLWCSSQDHREIRQLFTKAEKIQLSAAKNTGDIDKLLQLALNGRDYLDTVAESKKEEILTDLRKQVNRSFLWATLMLDIIKDALSLADVEEMVSQGIPHDFETYLERMVRRFPLTQHKFISDSLSCLVYARRPLFLDELCEAIEIHKGLPGDNIQPACLLMRDRLVDACGPLVRVDEGTETRGRQVCTLSHGAVKTFLVKHPHALSDSDNCRISPEILGTGCLKYLQQKRYKGLLKRGNMTFETPCGSDIKEHALLNYAAKYWHRHLDDVPYTSDLCNTVSQFVQSSNFMTCLQVQSLFVGGHFNFWYNSRDELQLASLVRAFPKWFVKKHHCGARIQKEYHAAIGEWSHYLSTQSTYAGKFRGEIERCLWGCLGEANFLHKVPSTIKSFILEDVGVEAPARTVKFYDRVSPDGSEIDFFKLTVQEPDSYLVVERWTLNRGRSPKLKATQRIILPRECLRFYQHELKKGVAEKASLLDVTSDGQVLRVGSQFYSGNARNSPGAETLYEPLQLPDGAPRYVQAVSCNSRYFAVAWRDQILEENVKLEVDPTPATGANGNDSSDTLLNCSSSSDSSCSSTGSSSYDQNTDNDSNSEDARSTMETSENQPAVSGSPERNATPSSNADSLEVRSEFSDRHGYDGLDWSDKSSLASNSARESWSEGSTSAKSDEIGEDRMLENFDDDSSLSFKEDGFAESGLVESSSGDHDIQLENTSSQHSSLSSAKSLDTFVDRSSDDHSSSESEQQAPSSMDDSAYDYSSSDQSDDDGEETQAAIARLENLLEIRQKKQDGASCEVQVYRLTQENNRPQMKVFSFRQRSQTRLYASPPTFHPTSDLLVWPLGDNEILFANFTENAYFIRTGTKSQPQSCQISVQCHFSDCGMYLHMASFEGIKMRYTDGEVRLGFKLLITTHRLSLRKTARSPPHLIYRTSVNLLGDLAEGEQLDVMNLPFSLSWGKDHLFVTEKCLRLLVHRLPLFRDVEKIDITPFAPRGVVHNLGDVFLPKSSLARKIHFFASEEWPKSADSTQSKTKSSRKGKSAEKSKRKYVAHVVLGSQNEAAGSHALEAVPNELLYARTAPQGFHLTPEHLGDWDGEQSHVLKQRSQTWRGGELMAKLEKFDMSEDCDIVPYLHY